MSDRARRILFVSLAVLLVGGGLLWHFADVASPYVRGQQALRDAGAELQSRDVPTEALTLTMVDADGLPHRLRDWLRPGEVALVHLWAGWCPPCRKELPALVKFAQSVTGRSMRVLAVSYDDEQAGADTALRETTGQVRPAGITWWRDPQGQQGDPSRMLRLKLGTEQLPETYVIADGHILARLIGDQDWAGARLNQAFQLLSPGQAKP